MEEEEEISHCDVQQNIEKIGMEIVIRIFTAINWLIGIFFYL